MRSYRLIGQLIRTLTLLFVAVSANATPIGWVSQVVLEGGVWRVKGWACEPGYGQTIGLDIYVGSTHLSWFPVPTTEWAEPDVHQACGTSPALGLTYRYSVPLNFSPAGQTITVTGVGPYGNAALSLSGQFHLPSNSNHPATVLATASKILLYTAHPDDEIIFAPLLGTYCAGKTCKIVVTTKGGGPSAVCHLNPMTLCGSYNSTTGYANIDAIRTGEMQTAASHVPATLEQASLTAGLIGTGVTVQTVIDRWTIELAAQGATFNSIVANEIDTFRPDVILTFDPRHGSTCHVEHRAVGRAIREGVVAYSGGNFNKSNLFIITSHRVVTSTGVGLTPVAPTSLKSTVYSAMDMIPSKGKTGWAYTIEDMGYHPSQFTSTDITNLTNAEALDKTTALAKGVDDYIDGDVDYNICP